MPVAKPKLDVGSIPKMDRDLNAISSTIGKGIKKPRSKRQIAKLAILRRQRGGVR